MIINASPAAETLHALAAQPVDLISDLDLTLMGGAMRPETRSILRALAEGLPADQGRVSETSWP